MRVHESFVFGKTSEVPRIKLYYNHWIPQANVLKPEYSAEFKYNVWMYAGENNNYEREIEVIIERPAYRCVGMGRIDSELYDELMLLATRGIYKNFNLPKSGKIAMFNGFPPKLGEELASTLNELVWYNRDGYMEIEFRYFRRGKAQIDGKTVDISGEIIYGRFEGKRHSPPATQTTLDKFLNKTNNRNMPRGHRGEGNTRSHFEPGS